MNTVVEKIIPILKKYGVQKASIFGSYARGNFNQESDVDILIEPPEDMGLNFVQLKLDLEDQLDKKVDLVSYKGISKYLKKYILETQIQII